MEDVAAPRLPQRRGSEGSLLPEQASFDERLRAIKIVKAHGAHCRVGRELNGRVWQILGGVLGEAGHVAHTLYERVSRGRWRARHRQAGHDCRPPPLDVVLDCGPDS